MKQDKSIAAADSVLPLQLRSVGYHVGKTQLLNGIDLTINAGRRLVVMGPNGAGKSLFLRLCHGLITPTSGGIFWQAQGPRFSGRRAYLVNFNRSSRRRPPCLQSPGQPYSMRYPALDLS